MMYAIIPSGFMHTNLNLSMFDEGLNAFNTTLDHFGKKRSNESLEVMLMNQHYRKESLRERSYSMHPCTSLTCDIGNTLFFTDTELLLQSLIHNNCYKTTKKC
jgi:hypothetical protein